MKPSNAKYQAAYRGRQSERVDRARTALQNIINEMGEPKGEKGRRIIAIAQEGLS